MRQDENFCFHASNKVKTGAELPPSLKKLFAFLTSVEVPGVQELMREMAAGLDEVLFVNRGDGRVVVRLTQYLAFVFAINGFQAFYPEVGIIAAGLTAAADTTAGTSHHFDEMIGRRSGYYLIYQDFCTCQTTGYGYFGFKTFKHLVFGKDVLEFQRGVLDLVETDNGRYMQLLEW